MQQGTEITTEISIIKDLDTRARREVEHAKDIMQGALVASHAVGARLDTLKASVGARRFGILIYAHFDSTFKERAKSYRKIVKADARQGLLSLGVIPDKDRAEHTIIKADPIFGWINKVSGHLRQTKTLSSAERVAIRGLQRDIERAIGPSATKS